MMKYPNPWNLTPRQQEAMDAVCDTGCQKLAARAIGVALPTLEAHIYAATTKMGLTGAPGRVRKYVVWAEWRTRQRAKEAAG